MSIPANFGNAKPSIDPANAAMLLIDHQSGLFQTVGDMPMPELRARAAALAKMATLANIPVITTASVPQGPNGPLIPEIHNNAPHAQYVARRGEINAWDNPDFVAAVEATGKKQLIIAGTITLGEFTAFLLYASILIWPFIALGWVVGLFQQGSASLNRMIEIYEARADIQEAPDALVPDKLSGEITFKNLTFAYESEQPVLQEINLQIPARQTIGVIGPTGSGKSTLVRAIPHLLNLPDGTVMIDGQDINRLSLKGLRARIGYVPQETFLFSATIGENIAYGCADASQEDIEWAAQMADIHEQIVDFPHGYDTLLGEKGINLSGGQKQRVSIARAILRKPDILILDDAFSALDTQTEAKILNNLEAFFPDRTVILVSHRVSTLQNCDLILVLEDGRITEQGVHNNLIRQGGLYAWIHEKQLLEDELAEVE